MFRRKYDGRTHTQNSIVVYVSDEEKYQIEVIIGMYRFSRGGGGISAPINTLTISPQGIITYSTS